MAVASPNGECHCNTAW